MFVGDTAVLKFLQIGHDLALNIAVSFWPQKLDSYAERMRIFKGPQERADGLNLAGVHELIYQETACSIGQYIGQNVKRRKILVRKSWHGPAKLNGAILPGTPKHYSPLAALRRFYGVSLRNGLQRGRNAPKMLQYHRQNIIFVDIAKNSRNGIVGMIKSVIELPYARGCDDLNVRYVADGGVMIRVL